MQMMYEIIYRALREAGLEDTYEPQDYLNFFCLHICETVDVDNTQNESPDSTSTPTVSVNRLNATIF
ncbi:Phospholipase D beta 1 [Dendrobium catenatum]|uniref:Phospholipase D beta 1 n=1 Tax=Dendrobium catenatum TaxID=906689 RepID=A0A2I0XAA0_9ASPA|nr:Phospholipase D beta 1 [Dendrobium catenatum]